MQHWYIIHLQINFVPTPTLFAWDSYLKPFNLFYSGSISQRYYTFMGNKQCQRYTFNCIWGCFSIYNLINIHQIYWNECPQKNDSIKNNYFEQIKPQQWVAKGFGMPLQGTDLIRVLVG